jgi:hypothetical protein
MKTYEGHTPGPWHWVDCETDLPWKPGSRFPSLRTVKEFETKFVGLLPKFILTNCDDVSEKDLPLIAAAPELLKQRDALLAACKTLLEEFDGDTELNPTLEWLAAEDSPIKMRWPSRVR